MPDEPIPKNPTIGFMYFELERRGKQVRGHPYNRAQLIAMLRELGVDVDGAENEDRRNTVER